MTDLQTTKQSGELVILINIYCRELIGTGPTVLERTMMETTLGLIQSNHINMLSAHNTRKVFIDKV